MNLVIVEQHEIDGGQVRLNDHRAKHVVKVLQADCGDELKIGVLHGKIGTGKITAIEKKYPFSIEVDVSITSAPPPKLNVDLVLALPRPIMLRRIFSQVAALGVSKIHLINAARVEKSFWDAGILDKSEYMNHFIHGLEQAVDTVPPEVFVHRRFRPFVEDFLPGIHYEYTDLIFAHPAAEQNLSQLLRKESKKVLIGIGPEGGWVDFEVESFLEQGFLGFTLGRRILKVDTAVINIHGRVIHELERLEKG